MSINIMMLVTMLGTMTMILLTIYCLVFQETTRKNHEHKNF